MAVGPEDWAREQRSRNKALFIAADGLQPSPHHSFIVLSVKKDSWGAGDAAQLTVYLSGMHEALGSIPHP